MRTILKIVNPPLPPALRCLTDLGVGEEAIVAHVEAPPAEAERLASLGVAPGAVVRLLRRGAALSLAVGEARIALGGSWARAVAVVPT